MLVEARFRRRASAGENLAQLNDELLRRLFGIEGLWIADRVGARYDAGGGESAATDLSPCLRSGIQGAISYASRLPAAIRDKAISDDSLVLEVDSELIEVQELCSDVFPKIIQAFKPYRASVVTDLDQDLDDFEEIVREAQETGRDVDGRDTVFRLHPVNYFDLAMCERAFGVGPDQIATKLGVLGISVRSFHEGVLLALPGMENLRLET